MGAKYHTVHHTHYHYNFGQVSILCYVCVSDLEKRADYV